MSEKYSERYSERYIYHITESESWEKASVNSIYRSETLDTEGFIHCSTAKQIVGTANRFYRDRNNLVLLCIDSSKVESEIRYEEADNQLFPTLITSQGEFKAVYKAEPV